MRRTGPDPNRPFKVPAADIAERIASAVIGHIGERTENGIDIHGNEFADYSKDYGEARERSGRRGDPPNLTLSGGMLGSVQVVERSEVGSTARVVVGMDTGTSSQTRLPPKGTGKRKRRKRTSAGGRSPSHADLGLYHQEGMGHLPQREWFGVSPDGDASIRRQMQDDLPPLKKG